MITIAPIEADMVEDYRVPLFNIYHATFTLPPWNETEAQTHYFSKRLPVDVARAGFCGAVAHDALTEQMVGFTYGYNWRASNLWATEMQSAIATQGAAWTDDCFELVEFAVVPPMQSQGIGRRLHDAVIQTILHRTALLLTHPTDGPALRFY